MKTGFDIGIRERFAVPGSRFLFLAVLGLVAAVVAGACGASSGGREPVVTQRVAIEAVAPKGDVSWPVTFQWTAKGVQSGSVYRVIVYDTAERQLLQEETRATRVDVPRMQALLPSTRKFQWRVAVLDGNGEPVVQTALLEFTVRSGRW